MKPLILALSLLLPLAALHAQDKEKKSEVLPAKDAKGKVGETVTIEAKVAEVNKTEKIVRINLGARFPNQELTLVIFSSNFSKFEDVEKLEGKTVRVTKVSEYQKRPQIVLQAQVPLLQVPVQTGSAASSKQDKGNIPPPSRASADKPRVVSPEAVAYLESRRKNPPFGAAGFDLKGLRAGMGSRQEPANKDIKLIRLKIGELPCEWVLAPGADPEVRLLYLHGGGWVSGSGGNYLRLAADLSLAAKCAVLLPDYRLAPEHPFPAGLEDCIAAHDWLIGNGPSGPGAAKATFIAGDSAGGNLTLATLLALRDRKRSLPA